MASNAKVVAFTLFASPIAAMDDAIATKMKEVSTKQYNLNSIAIDPHNSTKACSRTLSFFV
jgi:hypothetical protein